MGSTKTQSRQRRSGIIATPQRSPFGSDPSLCNIATGVVAEEGVNCDKAKEARDEIVSSMVGKYVHGYSFQKKQQLLTLASRKVQLVPHLLSQRLSIIATSGRYDNPEALFKYDMSSYPTALFDASLLTRQANKPVLADAIWTETEGS